MKGVTILVCAIFGIASATPYAYPNVEDTQFQQRVFEDVINKTITGIIARLAQYDPMTLPSRQADILGYSFLIENAVVEGFSNIQVSHVKLSGFLDWTFELELTAPRIAQSVEHWKVDGKRFYGDGSINKALNGLKFSLKTTVNPLTKVIKNLEFRPTVESAEVSITGVYNDVELSKQISDYYTYFLNNLVNNNDVFYDQLCDMIKDALNDLLH